MLTLIDSFAPVLLQASLACAAISLPVWLLLEWAVRRWPAMALSRSVWLLSQLLILAAFVLVLLPEGAQLSVLPPIEIERTASVVAAEAPLLVDAVLVAASDDIDPAAGGAWIQMLAAAWFALYCAGALVALFKVMAARRALRKLVALAQPLGPAALATHQGFIGCPNPGLPVFETGAAVSPMLIGCIRPLLLVPRSLRDFSDEQQQLIVAHELTHWRRGDPWLLHASILMQAVFWFNPVLRALGKHLGWAQELGCDRAVLAGQGLGQRREYASALVAQLKLQQSVLSPATLAFGGATHTSVSGRIGLIRNGGAQPAGRLAKVAVLTVLAALLAGGVMLQPVFAWRAETMPPAAATLAGAVQWRSPLQHPRVSSFYGVPRPNKPAGHEGIDFAAKTGTPVMAAAAGVVIDSTDQFERGAKYGKVIVIEHANGLRSTYAHLDQRHVHTGAVVAAGQQIGLSGATGKVTGAHLHLEVADGARYLDPASLIAGLDQGAFASALRKRDRAAIR